MAIDRYQLVARHNPVLRECYPLSPLTIGNGEFAYTADITGMQSFPDSYREKVPLCTLAQWGWHTQPAEGGRHYQKNELKLKYFDAGGAKAGYAVESEGQEEAYDWLRINPHRLHLGQIGMEIMMDDGQPAEISDIRDIHQQLDLWRGILHSEFTTAGIPVSVKSCCHPFRDVVAFSVESELLQQNRLTIRFAFPYGAPDKTAADWSAVEKHRTVVMQRGDNRLRLLRLLDNNRYSVEILYPENGRVFRTGDHEFKMDVPEGSGKIEFSVSFTSEPPRGTLPAWLEVQSASEAYWREHWSKGGAVELSGSSDPRAFELERRIVLSQYLTAIQCAGSLPPQETGLTCNSWYGKFHLEMHWWHAAHFSFWGRHHLLERSLWWYRAILPKARELAGSQGYSGARWPKMAGPAGEDAPSPIGPLLIWQQPHPIYYAELCYRHHPSRETLEAYREIVFETAEFMASYAKYDPAHDRYVLGPPLIPAQENHAPETTVNPVFELEYWLFGLSTANQWRIRLGLPLDQKWEEIAAKLAELPVKEGVYIAHENCPLTFSRFNEDHPSMLGACGVLPGRKAKPEVMRQTLGKVLREWRFETMWGWDFPMLAMTAARLGQPEIAVSCLLMDSPKNTYLPNGHNCQGDRPDLPLYLPGNGGLLTAVALMAAGWDGCGTETPGFPKDGGWKVRWEGLRPLI
ncbi:hypothetical protein EDC14_103720 [Hydrogenispora ethanolica]|jgi:hypothetical protein|uniref:Glycosyl hydrolase family 65 n=1 Tax=Hydrogenispora ethanolica TaxID=1082276 RepID=A0A4R1R304_HYDET|nr:glycoside hydrolase family 65 [Hydrogenispora ethanolica]TCL59783.1 hypothetical protein EDC14_103720 [Hydrogenispora ethanolica]